MSTTGVDNIFRQHASWYLCAKNKQTQTNKKQTNKQTNKTKTKQDKTNQTKKTTKTTKQQNKTKQKQKKKNKKQNTKTKSRNHNKNKKQKQTMKNIPLCIGIKICLALKPVWYMTFNFALLSEYFVNSIYHCYESKFKPSILYKFAMSVCLSVCLCRYAFGRASTYGAETWHGGRVWRSWGEPSTFRRDPTGQRSSRGQIVQECPMATKFGE